MQTRKSRQRDAIYAYLCGRKDHPTAEQIYSAVRQDIPNISLGTVYRNLALLTETGQILTLHTGDGSDRFDATTTPHDHFVCRVCHNVSDSTLPCTEDLIRTARESFGGRIESCQTFFYGVCEACDQPPM